MALAWERARAVWVRTCCAGMCTHRGRGTCNALEDCSIPPSSFYQRHSHVVQRFRSAGGDGKGALVKLQALGHLIAAGGGILLSAAVGMVFHKTAGHTYLTLRFELRASVCEGSSQLV